MNQNRKVKSERSLGRWSCNYPSIESFLKLLNCHKFAPDLEFLMLILERLRAISVVSLALAAIDKNIF